MMTSKQFQKYLARDKHCWHCGTTETLIPHHRSNRGMGGSKKLDRPSNIIVMCARANDLMESDAKFAALALRNGWKLSRYERPEVKLCFDNFSGQSCLLGDDWSRVVIP